MSAGGSRASRNSRRRLASTIGGGPATHARTPAKRPAIRSPATAWTKPRANENSGCAADSDAGTSSSDSAIVIASRSGYRARNAASSSRKKISRSEEHTSELQSLTNLVCRLLLEKKNKQ